MNCCKANQDRCITPDKKVPTNQPARIFLILIAIFVFGLPIACQTPPQWTPFKGDSGQVYPEANWQKAETPGRLGWSSKKLAEARAYSAKIDPAAVMLVDDGVVVAARGDVTRKFKCHSMRKSLLSALIGILVNAGNIDLHDEMAVLLKDTRFRYDQRTIDGYGNACKEINIASRDTNFDYAFLLEDYRCNTARIEVKHHLTHTAQGEPGAAYRYNAFLFGFLSPVAEAGSGKNFADLLAEKIIRPLNITRTVPSISDGIRRQVLADRAKYYKMGFGGDFVPSILSDLKVFQQ